MHKLSNADPHAWIDVNLESSENSTIECARDCLGFYNPEEELRVQT